MMPSAVKLHLALPAASVCSWGEKPVHFSLLTAALIEYKYFKETPAGLRYHIVMQPLDFLMSG